MTMETKSENAKSSHRSWNLRGAMPVRQRLLRDRHARALGLARSFAWQPARTWRRLRHLCRKLAQGFSHYQGPRRHYPLRGQSLKNRAKLLRAMRHAAVLRTRALAAHGEHPARAVHRAHRTAAALSHRHRGAAGMGLYRRAAGAAERVSRRGLAAFEKEETPRSRGDVLVRPGTVRASFATQLGKRLRMGEESA